MKFSICLFLIVSAITLVCAKPPPHNVFVKILKSDFDLEPEGAYKYGFETENGIVRDEVGEIKLINNEKGHPEPVIVARGYFSYIDHNGQQYEIKYIADENGFQPEGAHLPHV